MRPVTRWRFKMRTEISMKFEKATKNTLRFTEELKDSSSTPIIGTLYVQKSSFKDKIPQSIKVSIEWD
jgi:hypothetical protein